ncbi:hypothetical protein WN48_09897 [Eufriesea mexicana]|nr:hypothetical protein WN48_09897 [Eufriesea mexicana]
MNLVNNNYIHDKKDRNLKMSLGYIAFRQDYGSVQKISSHKFHHGANCASKDNDSFVTPLFQLNEFKCKCEQRRSFLTVSVEGRNRSRRYHGTVSSDKHQNVNRSGLVTKIELELEEAPDDMILVGSMPSELDVTGEINSTYPDGIPGPGEVIVRAEEALIVILVLLLWAAAIALFFNRWGKIRMLEPYQPKFQQQHRQSCIPGPGEVIVRAEEALIVILVLLLWAAAIALFFNRWGKIRMLEPYQPKFQQQHRQSCTTLEQNPLQNPSLPSGLIASQRCVTNPAFTKGQPQKIHRVREVRVRSERNSTTLPRNLPRIFHRRLIPPTIEKDTQKTHEVNRRTFSKCNILCGDYPAGHELSCVPGQMRPRQNSVFIGSSASLLPGGQGTPRRTKSAFDLQFLVLSENNPVDPPSEQDALRSLKPAGESTKLLQRERRTSVCQLDRPEKPIFRDRGMSICQFDASPKSWQRDRGMSICQFDRMEVLARPLQRDRGGSICHFDRMDVLARPLQRDRIGSTYHFDRMDVLARPNFSLGKSLLRERRVSMCNFLEKDEETARAGQMERRLSSSNIEKIEKDESIEEFEVETGRQEIFAKCVPKEKKYPNYQLDQPSCSKTPDPVFGYKATCV